MQDDGQRKRRIRQYKNEVDAADMLFGWGHYEQFFQLLSPFEDVLSADHKARLDVARIKLPKPEWPAIKLVRATDISATGIAVKPAGAPSWQYFLPFAGQHGVKARDGSVGYGNVSQALVTSETRVLVASGQDELALIDVETGEIIARQRVSNEYILPRLKLQLSGDFRHIIAQVESELFVLDATTLAIVRKWNDVDNECRINLPKLVRQIPDGRLILPLYRNEMNLCFVFDIASGAASIEPDAEHFNTLSAVVGAGWDAITENSHPPEACEELGELVAKDLKITLPVANGSRDAAIAVVEELCARMEAGVDALLMRGTINLRYLLDGIALGDEAFFDRFVQERWTEAVPVLKRLLAAYFNGINEWEPEDRPWPSSCRVLRALVLLDADQHDVYRLYLQKRNHFDEYAIETLYPEYVARHGYRKDADIGFFAHILGESSAMFDPRDAREGWLDSGLFQQAEKLMTPERFAKVLLGEFGVLDDNDIWKLDKLLEALEGGGTYPMATAKEMRSLRDRK